MVIQWVEIDGVFIGRKVIIHSASTTLLKLELVSHKNKYKMKKVIEHGQNYTI